MKHARIQTRAAANIEFPPVNENPVVTRDADWSREPDHQAYLPPRFLQSPDHEENVGRGSGNRTNKPSTDTQDFHSMSRQNHQKRLKRLSEVHAGYTGGRVKRGA